MNTIIGRTIGLNKEDILGKSDLKVIIYLDYIEFGDSYTKLKQKKIASEIGQTKSDVSRSLRKLQNSRIITKNNSKEYKFNVDFILMENYSLSRKVWKKIKGEFDCGNIHKNTYRVQHTKLVHNIALFLADHIKGNERLTSRELYLLSIVSILHDHYKGMENHAEEISDVFEEKLKDILNDKFIFSKDELKIMKTALKLHSNSGKKENIIVKILQDADKLSKYPKAFDFDIYNYGLKVNKIKLENFIEEVKKVSNKHQILNLELSNEIIKSYIENADVIEKCCG